MPVDFAATHHFFLATFRSPRLYTFSFTPSTNALVLEHTNTASGGHNWLDLSADKKYLYATGWTDPPTLAAYKIVSAPATRYPAVQLINTVSVAHTPGYICSNGKAVFSVSGPQGDVFLVDPVTGGFKTQEPQQSVRFAEGTLEDQDPMDFGGLRHGAHVSCSSLLIRFIS
jgi:carboxy-cis,cis-muconate cyclase